MRLIVRNFLLLLSLTVAFGLRGQDKVTYVSDGTGTISLRVLSYGKKSKEAMNNAEKVAIQTILFRGIPGSNQVEYPLVGVNEKAIQEQHGAYFKELFDKERYHSFIISNVPISQFEKDATKKKRIIVDVKVNIRALRLDLEQNGIIRKFGF
ncbi:hypothetical protein BARVI_03655 [Barnesiella viscericola DSM 18177]|uniref:Uncharacterized protein n=1 Tax=Barnesiella viscericola DSM 18177 TaxID=880074 RepID=W0EWV4_9BACT|nr:hypothetical protein [Barnesiella viscericola]AHF13664.1 hypothetical protein BARVI_03655 [Barnesiella viscericola DSM 18177]